MSTDFKHHNRREFLRRSGTLSLAGAATPWALNLATMAEAAAAFADAGAENYKDLVCAFLYGGNNHGNSVVPDDLDSHNAYSKVRGSIALPRDSLAATALAPSQALPDGRQMALAPTLAPLKPLFDDGRLALLLNVGTLIQPTTLAQYKAAGVPLPPKLFSHNDHQSVW